MSIYAGYVYLFTCIMYVFKGNMFVSYAVDFFEKYLLFYFLKLWNIFLLPVLRFALRETKYFCYLLLFVFSISYKQK